MAKFNVGSFFKNAIKGAAQQYNANVAFERKRQAEEEAGIAASKRDFENRRKLIMEEQKWKAHFNASVPKKDDKKYAAMFNVLNPKYNTDLFNQKVQTAGFGEFFKDGKIRIPRGANYESANDQQKREDTFTQMSTVMNPKFLQLFNDDPALTNTIITSLADAWQNNLILEEDKNANGKKVWTFKKSQWDYLSGIPELAEIVAQRVGTKVKELDKYIKESGDYSDGNATMYEFTKERFAFGTNDFFRNIGPDGKKLFNEQQVGILKRIAPRTPGIDVSKPIKISSVANELNDFAKAQGTVEDKNKQVVQKVTAGEIIDAIAVAMPILQDVDDPRDINNSEKTDALKRKLKKLGFNHYLYNDPQVMLKVISNALPASFRYQQNLQFSANGQIDLKQRGILKEFVGGSSPRASMNIKQRSATDLQNDAASVMFLIDNEAETGAAASIPRNVVAFGNVVQSLMGSAVKAFGGDGRIVSKFGDLFSQHQEEYNAAINSPDDSGKEQRIKNALLKFYATRMTFRLAADIQNTGGTQAGPRISDDDVARIQEGLQLLFLADDVALREIAEAIHADAEKKKVIYQAYMSSDIKEVATAHIMQNMQGGDIVDTVFKISRKYKDKLKGSKFGNKEGLVIRGFGSVTSIEPVKIDGQGDGKKEDSDKKGKPRIDL
jgi:hypothetical protein